MNAVDENIRRTFESDWLRGSRGEIADYLPQPDQPSFLPTLEELICIDLEFRWKELSSGVGEFSATVETLPLAPPPVIEDYLQRFPQLNEPEILQRLIDQEIWARKDSPYPPSVAEYQQRFPQLGLPLSTLRALQTDSSADTIRSSVTLAPEEILPRPFGPYELLQQLGRGGMGTVYRARQRQAEREVAMKIAKIDTLPREVRQEVRLRFESEIRAAAKLKHDNLMPVYDVGEVDGSLYYTMPIVDGDLAAEVRQQPLTNARAATYLAQAARGLAVAHAEGLLHRDIKPHNLMLDRRQDRVLVADFGLARLASAEQQLTITGQVLGTPPYMAAEQIRDSRTIDARADVYALGATLYHLLVGRPPFQAATSAETLRQVLEDDPASPRHINPQIDPDLETICLRCLQKEPALRFSSSRDLADDLDRYLRGEPIVSRPLSLWGRLLRWSRRNPVVAALAAGLATALLLVALVAAGGWISTQRQLNRVVANSRQGQAALNELFTFVRTEPLLDQPGQEAVRQYLLDRGLKHYESLVTLAAENETLPADLLAARNELGLLALELRGPDAAAEQFRQVIAAAAQLPEERQAAREVRETLGDSWNALGQAEHRLGDEQAALAAFQQAIEIRRKIVAQAGNDAEAQRKLANALMNQALVDAALRQVGKSRTQQEEAQRQRRKLLADDAQNAKLLRDVAQGEFNLARLALTHGEQAEGLARLRDATDRFAQLTRDYPIDARIWQRYIECLLTLAMFEDAATDAATAQSRAEQAIAYLQPLASLAPENRTYRLRLVELYQQAIEQLLTAGHAAAAEPPWQTMQTQLIARLAADDLQPDAVRVRLNCLRQRGLISLGLGRKDEAKAQLQTALDAWRTMQTQGTAASLRTPAWDADWASLEALANSL